MTISITSPTSTTSKIQQNGSDVLTVDSSNNVTVINNLSVSGTVSSTGAITFNGGVSGNVNFDSGTLYVDATNNRVGIGTSSPAIKLDVNGIVGGSGSAFNPGTTAWVSAAFKGTGSYGGGISFVDGSNGATIYAGAANLIFGNGATSGGTLERMRITSTGDVGIGTSSPGTNGPLSIERNGNASSELNISLINGISNKECIVNFGNNLATAARYKGRIFYQTDNNVMGFWTNTTERMRIASNGYLRIGCTSSPNAATTGVEFVPVLTSDWCKFSAGSTGGIRAIGFYNPNGLVGDISTNGSGTLFNTSSDYRLKENNVNITDGISRVKLLKPYRFNFIADASVTVDGFFAHEVQDVVPEAITKTKDAMRTEEYEVTPAVLDDDGNVVTEAVMGTREVPDYQGIDQSKLVPLLTAALQEAITKIEDLETRIEALESN